MTLKQRWILIGLTVFGMVLAYALLHLETPRETDETDMEMETQKNRLDGPHGGKFFTEGDFGLEILVVNDDSGAHLRIYRFSGKQILPPDAASLSALLTRADGKTEKLSLKPERDFLQSVQTIADTQLFTVTVSARRDNQLLNFSWHNETGKIELTDRQIEAAGLIIATAHSQAIRKVLSLPGEIRFNADRTAHLSPRLAGAVETVQVELGDRVKRGQVLAVLASPGLAEQRSALLSARKRLELAKVTSTREKHLWEAKISAELDYLKAEQTMSEEEIAVFTAEQKLLALGVSSKVNTKEVLNRYPIRAPFDGMIVEKHIAQGETVTENTTVFTLSDLSSIWAELIVSANDLKSIRIGQQATIKAIGAGAIASGTVSYIGSFVGEQTRAAKAYITLANPELAWRPGLFTRVEIVDQVIEAPVAVLSAAIQRVDGKVSVLVRVPGGFVPRPVETGLSDGRYTEIISGLEAGAQYAADGSFVLKSEHEKSGLSDEG